VKPVSVAADGTLVFIAGSLFPIHRLAWASRDGKIQEWPSAGREMAFATLSPDGRRLVEQRVESGAHTLWLRDIARDVEERLTSQGSSSGPVWKRDGSGFAFIAMSEGHFDVAVRQLDEPGPRLLINEPLDQTPSAWTRDGQHLVVYDYLADGSTALTLADVSKPSSRQRLVTPAGYIHRTSLSPDDRWLALEISRGQREILVQRFPAGGAPVSVSQNGGRSVHWSSNGRQLFYQHDNELVQVTLRDDNGRFTIEREERLFQLDRFSLTGVAPDGRFLIGQMVSGPDRVQVMLNWRPGA
jgi:Tol biopolymer transport system component